MPSKGSSRSSETRMTATAIAPGAGPPVATPLAVSAVVDAEPIWAMVGEGIVAGGTPTAGIPQPEPFAFVEELEEPDVDSPEWADLYARSVARFREDRDRIDREQANAQQLWDEFLAAQSTGFETVLVPDQMTGAPPRLVRSFAFLEV